MRPRLPGRRAVLLAFAGPAEIGAVLRRRCRRCGGNSRAVFLPLARATEVGVARRNPSLGRAVLLSLAGAAEVGARCRRAGCWRARCRSRRGGCRRSLGARRRRCTGRRSWSWSSRGRDRRRGRGFGDGHGRTRTARAPCGQQCDDGNGNAELLHQELLRGRRLVSVTTLDLTSEFVPEDRRRIWVCKDPTAAKMPSATALAIHRPARMSRHPCTGPSTARGCRGRPFDRSRA